MSVRPLLLAVLLALPVAAAPPVDTDPACAAVCGDVAGVPESAPTTEEFQAIQALALARIRQMIVAGDIKTWWWPMYATELWYMQEPSVGPYPWRTNVSYCSKKMLVYGLAAGVPGWYCASGIAYKDRIVVSLWNAANVRPLLFWESANSYLGYRLGQMELTDGPLVGQITSWGMATVNKATIGKVPLAPADIQQAAPAPKQKEPK